MTYEIRDSKDCVVAGLSGISGENANLNMLAPDVPFKSLPLYGKTLARPLGTVDKRKEIYTVIRLT